MKEGKTKYRKNIHRMEESALIWIVNFEFLKIQKIGEAKGGRKKPREDSVHA
jgi:hypothetical protein